MSQQISQKEVEDIKHQVEMIAKSNKLKIDDLLGQKVQLQSTNILNLYQLVIQQWEIKRGIIEQLTQILTKLIKSTTCWISQKIDYESSLQDADAIIEALKQNLNVLKIANIQKSDKNMICSNITQVSLCNQIQVLSITQKNRTQQFISQQIQTELIQKICESCKLYEMENIKLKNKIQQLQKYSKLIEEQLQQVRQQSSLMKIQVELAQIAVKDALSSKNNKSFSRDQNFHNQQMMLQTKSQGNILSRELQYFSNFQDSFDQFKIQKKMTNPQINFDSNHQQSFQLKLSSNQQIIAPNPFKKKMGRNDEKRRFHTEYIDDSLSDAFKTSKMSNMANISKKTAAIQCNLLKNIPKITLFTRKQSENKNKMNQSTINTTNFTYNKKTTNKNESSQFMSKSVIINSGKGSNEIKKNMNSFNNFFTYISSKVVKDRIKVK